MGRHQQHPPPLSDQCIVRYDCLAQRGGGQVRAPAAQACPPRSGHIVPSAARSKATLGRHRPKFTPPGTPLPARNGAADVTAHLPAPPPTYSPTWLYNPPIHSLFVSWWRHQGVVVNGRFSPEEVVVRGGCRMSPPHG